MVVKSGNFNSAVPCQCHYNLYCNCTVCIKDLVKDIAQLVNEKKIDGIATIRDESDRDGMRIVIELKKATQADVVLDNLYVKTKLQSVVSCTMRAVVDEGRKPELLTLKRALQLFIDFRHDIVLHIKQ